MDLFSHRPGIPAACYPTYYHTLSPECNDLPYGLFKDLRLCLVSWSRFCGLLYLIETIYIIRIPWTIPILGGIMILPVNMGEMKQNELKNPSDHGSITLIGISKGLMLLFVSKIRPEWPTEGVVRGLGLSFRGNRYQWEKSS